MKKVFPELPGWSFEVEALAGVYHITATEKSGRTFDMKGVDRDLLLSECRQEATALSEQTQFGRS